MSKKNNNALQTNALALRHRRYGWAALLLWLLFGLILEMLHGFKFSNYLLDPIRKEFWSLAHFHGAALALANLIYVQWVDAPLPAQRNLASYCLLIGSILMPLGFFLGGLVHFEGDPGIGIFLAPPGALLILVAVYLQVVVAFKQSKP